MSSPAPKAVSDQVIRQPARKVPAPPRPGAELGPIAFPPATPLQRAVANAWRLVALAVALVAFVGCIAAAHRLYLWGWP